MFSKLNNQITEFKKLDFDALYGLFAWTAKLLS